MLALITRRCNMRNDHVISFLVSLPVTLVTFAFGQDSAILSALFVLMVADYVTGILASVVDGKGLSSAIGFRGLLKKFAVVVIIAVTHHIDLILGTTVAMLGAVYFYAGIELISITENCGRMGVPMPAAVRNAIQVLKERIDLDGDEVESSIHDYQVPFDCTEQETERNQD